MQMRLWKSPRRSAPAAVTPALSMAERVEAFKRAFPTNEAAWPWLVTEQRRPTIYATWLGGQDYR
ncbi:MAG TPA: hypothetical protein VHZ73_08465, partial [Vicinamibacterales bacterium]|nr:hypothetical protein [Vicinamibacterales bacterium]